MNDVRSPWHFDRAAALDRLDHDEDLLWDVVQQFIDDAPALLAAIEAAIGHNDADALRDAAHSLKGSAGYLAADDLCMAAQTLEGLGRANLLDDARRAWPAFATEAGAVVAALRTEASGR
jgi:two-component system sensor histidine kinase/response regulator